MKMNRYKKIKEKKRKNAEAEKSLLF